MLAGSGNECSVKSPSAADRDIPDSVSHLRSLSSSNLAVLVPAGTSLPRLSKGEDVAGQSVSFVLFPRFGAAVSAYGHKMEGELACESALKLVVAPGL